MLINSGVTLNNRYRLQEPLNHNSVRQTWLADDLIAGDRVVIKLLALGGAVQWDDLKLLQREAQILRQLNHSHLLKYRDYFSIDNTNLWFGLVTEYIAGASLKQKLEEKQTFTQQQVEWIASEVLQILNYLHQHHPPILHRDIKPSNLMWGEGDRIYLIDFGSVQVQPTTPGTTFTVVGTYGYTPLEQFVARTVPASDLYALGATLVHLLTGITPADLPQENFRLKFRDRLLGEIDPKFISWLEKLTEPALENRFVTAKQALAALQTLEAKPLDLDLLPENTAVCFSKSSMQLKIEIPSLFWVRFIQPMRRVFLNFVNRIKTYLQTLPEAKKHKIAGSSILAVLGFFLLPPGLQIFFLNTILTIIFIPLQLLILGCPVWLIVGVLLSSAEVDYFESVILYFDNKIFDINWRSSRKPERKTGEISQIKNVNLANFRDNNGNYHTCLELTVQDRVMLLIPQQKSYLFGQQLREEELQWLRQEIADWIAK